MIVQFERREQLAPGIWQYFFRPERPVDFVPGQYAGFYMLQPLRDPRGNGRIFSFTSLPTDEFLSFVVKFTTLISPYKQALQALMPGDELRIDDPMGDLVLPKSPAIPLVFIAGGIGIASFASMLQQLIASREERPVFLFYAVRRGRERIFTELLSSYPLALKSVTIAPHRLTADEIVASVPETAQLYLSGSQPFVEGLRGNLQALGVSHERLAFDYFDGYTEL